MKNQMELTEAPKIIVAIDGFSSSGKSTMARELAKRVSYIYVDSGAMYRAVTLFALNKGLIDEKGAVNTSELISYLPEIDVSFQQLPDEEGVQHTLLNGKDVEKEIRDMAVSSHVSFIAEIPEVRERMVQLQQKMGLNKGIVMDGRDIGTTVFPDAELKIFVVAGLHERARRRWKELSHKGKELSYEEVYKNLEERDRLDTTREISPLVKAEDAIEFNNGAVTHEEQMEWVIKLFQETLDRIENESRD